MKENYGDLTSLQKLGKSKKYSFTTEQLLDPTLKNVNGESRIEVQNRMLNSFTKILTEHKGKKIVIVSHGAAVKFLLLPWCKLNHSNDLIYNNRKLTFNSPGILKILLQEETLIDIIQLL